MKPITINADYRIISGKCSNLEGKAVGFDSIEDEVMLRLDPFTLVLISSEDVEIIGEQMEMSLGSEA
ncbi:hypothetical protein [Paenibacillus urinalis]|uniref:hypothetical protein n=1 Tax=Paenibacillus urinalis TaxID=521520 RepID=UPI0019614AED